ncbi:MAG: hypothetical protein KC501_30090 [Myxococcales bacterium]|nr:hypothetical protein [Myxococcales bacterium]
MSRRGIALTLGLALALPGPVALAAEPEASAPAPSLPPRRPGDRMVQAGVGITVAGVLGYGLMAAGLGVGNQAEGDLVALGEREDIEVRRETIARGQLGNRLAIAGAVTASVALAVGIPLIAIGRRRHEASAPRVAVLVGGTGAAMGLRLRARF